MSLSPDEHPHHEWVATKNMHDFHFDRDLYRLQDAMTKHGIHKKLIKRAPWLETTPQCLGIEAELGAVLRDMLSPLRKLVEQERTSGTRYVLTGLPIEEIGTRREAFVDIKWTANGAMHTIMETAAHYVECDEDSDDLPTLFAAGALVRTLQDCMARAYRLREYALAREKLYSFELLCEEHRRALEEKGRRLIDEQLQLAVAEKLPQYAMPEKNLWWFSAEAVVEEVVNEQKKISFGSWGGMKDARGNSIYPIDFPRCKEDLQQSFERAIGPEGDSLDDSFDVTHSTTEVPAEESYDHADADNDESGFGSLYQAPTHPSEPRYVETSTSVLVLGFRSLAQEYFDLQARMALALQQELRWDLEKEDILFALAGSE